MRLSRRRLALGLITASVLGGPLFSPAEAAPADWFDGARPGAVVQQALALLAEAGSHGLRPQDYGLPALRQAVEQAAAGTLQDATRADALGAALDEAMQRYLRHLHLGRVDPQQVFRSLAAPRREPYDAAGLLQAALADRSGAALAALVRDAAPRLSQYARLREVLAQYRALADDAAWATPLPRLPGKGRGKLEPGQAWDGLAPLARRLVLLGDLDPGAVLPAQYDEPLVTAVQAFQRRHGLAADGVVGGATLAALQVTPAARVRQLELALERLRWTPLATAPRMIVVNIPEFVLRAYEVRDGRIEVMQTMKVIVGRALDTRTPLFDADMKAIEFSPYWNVPPSIARGETVPRLRRDPGYFEREGFEFVGADGRADTQLTSAKIEALRVGQIRIRQRPGPRNALGDIKFVFPNSDHIFLHHTPSVGLFERDRRDFSHGCIRVEAPVALAQFVLRDRPDWPEARIREAMAARESNTLALQAPVRVLIAYGTALIKDGRVHFFDDVYGQDRKLDAALRAPAR